MRTLLALSVCLLAVPSLASAQRCRCEAAPYDACCRAWTARDFTVRMTVGAAGLVESAAPTPTPPPAPPATPAATPAPQTPATPATPGVAFPEASPLTAPTPLDVSSLLPPLAMPAVAPEEGLPPGGMTAFARLFEGDRTIAERQRAAEAGPEPTAEQARALTAELDRLRTELRAQELNASRAFGADGGESAAMWLFIGEARRRLAESANRAATVRFEACTQNCGTRPRLNLEQAAVAFQNAARLGGGTDFGPQGLLRMGESLVRVGAGERAKPLMEALARAEPDSVLGRRAQLVLGQAHLSAGRYVPAIEAFRAAAAEESLKGAATYGIVAAEALHGRLGPAAAALVELLALPPGTVPRAFVASAIDLLAEPMARARDFNARSLGRVAEPVKQRVLARVADRAWAAGHHHEAMDVARAARAAMSAAQGAEWDARRVTHANSPAATPATPTPATPTPATPTPATPVAATPVGDAPTAESGVIGWLEAASRACLAAQPDVTDGEVRLDIRMRRDEISVRASGRGGDALLECFRHPIASPVQPRRSTTIDATIRLSR